jgi:ABC-2 type transport system ATP-binding protein
LRELNAAGQTILLTTHYMEEADQLCGRVAIMDRGKILALDTPAALKQQIDADTIVTVTTAGDRAELGRILTERVAGVTRTRTTDSGVELNVKGHDRLLPRVVSVVEEAGFPVLDLSVSEPTLETVFINLTGKELREG